MRNLARLAVVLWGVSVSTGARALELYSTGNGDWSNPNVWVSTLIPPTNQVPTAADEVFIRFGHVVTVDTTLATAMSITVNPACTLRFSTTTSSVLTLPAQDLWVQGGGILEMGTPAAPVPAGVTARLVLPPIEMGTWRHGLFMDPGGVFVSQGAPKTPVALSASTVPAGALSLQVPAAQAVGWGIGDTITISQGDNFVSPAVGLQNKTEVRAITGFSVGGGSATVSWLDDLDHDHVVSGGVRVANLTRNVVVTSSGTDLDFDTSYFVSQGPFSAALTEFDRIGVEGTTGFDMQGNGAVMSSCTVRNGRGVRVMADGGTFADNVFHGNTPRAVFKEWWSDDSGTSLLRNEFIGNEAGVEFSGSAVGDDVFLGNVLYSNRAFALATTGSKTLFSLNRIYANGNDEWWSAGIFLGGADCTVSSNTIIGNGSVGIRIEGSGGHVLASNAILFNGKRGITFGPGRAVAVSNEVGFSGEPGIELSNQSEVVMAKSTVRFSGDVGIAMAQDSAITVQESALGYDPAGNSAPSVGSELHSFAWLSNQKAVLKGCRVNPLTPPRIEGFNQDDLLLSYNQDFATGTVRLTGQLLLSAGESLSLDHAAATWASTATAPALMKGTGHAAAVPAVSDAAAVTQLVTVRCVNGASNQWVVEGSASGTLYGPFTGPLSSQVVSGGQFALSFTPGPSPRTDDRVSFLLLASSRDPNLRKSLLFMDNLEGPASRLTVAPGASFALKGVSGTPALMAKGETDPVVFVSSGSVTLASATVTDLSVEGLQFFGSGAVSISSVTFDGIAAAGGAYVTARDLVSNATFTNVGFLDAPARTPFSVDVQGDDAGMRWYFASSNGTRAGDTRDNDPNQRVLWADNQPPDLPGGFSAAPGGNTGEITLAWITPADRESNLSASPLKGGSFRIFRSTRASDLAGVTTAQAQIVLPASAAPATPQNYVDGSLLLGSSYYYRLWAGDEFDNFAAATASTATAARVTPVPAPGFAAAAAGDQITLTWTTPGTPPPAYMAPYELWVSSVSNTGPFSLLTTIAVSSTSHVHPGLTLETSYFYRLFTLDTGGGAGGISAPATSFARTADIVAAQAVLSAGPRAMGSSLTPPLTISFTKPMQAASVISALSLRRVKDNLSNAVDEPVAVSVSSNPAGDFFTVGTPALQGNSLYVLSVSSAALDFQGKALGAAAGLSVLTLLNHAVRNVVSDGLLGAAVDLAPFAVAADGYLEGGSGDPVAEAAAGRKLEGNGSTPFHRVLPGSAVDLAVFDSSSALQAGAFAAEVDVSLPYVDADGDGFVDGSNPPVKARALSVGWLNERDQVWVRLPSSVDAASRRVTARARHFTTFALLSAPDDDLSQAYAYPVPFTPRSGRSTITFLNVGQRGAVRIYTVGGALVRELPADGNSQTDWDVRNADGEPVGQGVYYYEVKSGENSRTGKLAVVR